MNESVQPALIKSHYDYGKMCVWHLQSNANNKRLKASVPVLVFVFFLNKPRNTNTRIINLFTESEAFSTTPLTLDAGATATLHNTHTSIISLCFRLTDGYTHIQQAII